MNVQHVFLDNNIIYDYTEQRRPFYFEALQLIDLAVKNQYKMYLSVGAIINAYYIYRKLPLELVDKQFRFFVDRFTMVPFTADSIQEGVYSEWKDREDAFVHFSIRKHFPEISYLVTRNAKDFTLSHLQVVSPTEMLTILKTDA